MLNTTKIVKFPLLPAQEGVFFHTTKEQASNPGIYITQTVISLNSKLDLIAFWRAWDVVLKRHDLLRSKIEQSDSGRPVFSVLSDVKLATKVMNLSSVGDDQQRQIFNNFLKADLTKPFDWEKPPYMRFCLFQCSETHQKLVWSVQHVILGMANTGVTLLTEVLDLYDAFVKGNTLELAPVKPYYRVLECIEHYGESSSDEYWKKQLCGFSEPTPRPLDNGVDNGSSKQSSYNFSISSEIYKQCVLLAEKHQFSINTFIQTAWGLLLNKYTGENDVVFGSVRGYPKEIVDNSVGLFFNTLPIRLEINREISVLECLRMVREQQDGIRRHVTTPLYKIQALVKMPLLFNTVVDFKPISLLKAVTRGNKHHIVEEISFEVDTNYPLLVSITDEGSFLSGKIHYTKDLYSIEQIIRLASHFTKLLQELTEDTTKNVHHIQMLSEQEKSLLLTQWNQAKHNFAIEKNVIQLFEEQVCKFPNKPALFIDNTSVTYSKLNNHANGIAQELLARDIESDDIVGVYAGRGVKLIAAILGILKAGAAYLPLDPKTPKKRLNYILQDSQIKLVLIDGEGESEFKKITNHDKDSNNVDLVIIDFFTTGTKVFKNLVSHILPKQLAYAIYTSGTTGRPKGVLVEHQALTNTALTHKQRLNISETSRVLQFSNPTFDVSVAEWSATLISGATLCILPNDAYFLGDTLASYLEDHQISVALLTGSVLQTMPHRRIESLKTIVVGGEGCSQKDIKFWSKNRLFINAYGLTETAVCVTMHEASSNSEENAIGKPTYNNNVYVLGKNHGLLPVGAVGELYIGGANLARSYLNDKQLTQDKFVYINEITNARLFKSGDLVKWSSGGDLFFIGRNDNQVKIRGHRVELDEISNTIKQIYGVEQCAVVVNNDEFQHKTIIAYIKGKVSIQKIKDHLKSTLASYMIPSVFLEVEDIPLTTNGKVDHRALLKKYVNTTPHKTVFANSLEGIISNIWKQLLHINKISVDENLFDIGAHSLLMLEASVLIGQQLKCSISIVDLFQYPTIRLFSEYLKRRGTVFKQNEGVTE